jgi:chromosome segregation ATPase
LPQSAAAIEAAEKARVAAAAEAAKESAALREALDASKAQLIAVEKAFSESGARIESLTSKVASLKEQLAAKTAEASQAATQLTQVRAAMEEAVQAAAERERRDAAATEALRQEVAGLRQEVAGLQKRITNVKELEAAVEVSKTEAAKLRRQLETATADLTEQLHESREAEARAAKLAAERQAKIDELSMACAKSAVGHPPNLLT